MSMSVPPPDFWDEYEQSDRALRLRHAKLGCILTMVLMPSGSTLDFLVYPDLAGSFFVARVMTNLALALILGLLFLPLGQRCLAFLSSAWVMLPAIAIAWMIYSSEGVHSPYYAGLNLLIIIGCLPMPYTRAKAAAVCLLVTAIYLVACFAHEKNAGISGQLLSNLVSIALISIIVVTSCHLYRNRRINEVRHRYEMSGQNRRLAELDRLKSEFIANISHELRTPLALILSPIDQVLERSTADDPQRDRADLGIARHHALRLFRLIDQLLELARIDSRQTEGPDQSSTHERIDLAATVSGLTKSFQIAAARHELILAYEGSKEGLWIQADVSSIERIGINLITNAIKFTPAGGRITIQAQREEGEAILEVEDTGQGIAAEQIDLIFDRFRQLDRTAKRGFQGAGLGLSLVKELVEELHGAITVTSKLGKGSCFRVSLPLWRDATAKPTPDTTITTNTGRQQGPDLARSQLPGPLEQYGREALLSSFSKVAVWNSKENSIVGASGSGVPRSTGERLPCGYSSSNKDDSHPVVLVVDDEPDMLRSIVSLLNGHFKVVHASNGKEALEIAIEHRPAVAMIDMMMPEMGGYELCERLKSNGSQPELRTIMLTARDGEDLKLRALRSGFDDFLTKPFRGAEVRVRIHNLASIAELERRLRQRGDELQQALDDLRQARSELIQNDKMQALGVMAAGLLHEINNPLNYTLTALQCAKQGVVGQPNVAEITETLDDIDDGMRRIQNIIGDVQTFAHPDRLGEQRQIQIHQVVRTGLRIAGPALDGISIETEVPDGLEAMGSAGQITQVLVNLLTNAARACREVDDTRHPTISIRAGQQDDQVFLAVEDNGVGMSRDVIERASEPFFTTRDVGQGLGLGLSVCNTIIRSHGGALEIQSTPGEGTTMLFHLNASGSEMGAMQRDKPYDKPNRNPVRR
ncbi:MAG: ATP-binding protein [Planctomycetota bacterium]